jgi:hypothetical protein
MAMYFLSVPPPFFQEELYCWAAGAASWLRAMKLGVATPEQLIIRFGPFMNRDGTLPEDVSCEEGVAPGGMKEVFRQLRIFLTLIPRSEFNYWYVLDKLQRKGHLLLLEQVNGSMGHTTVIYGVGYPSDGFFSVFDPIGGYRNRPFTSVGGDSVYIGWTALLPPY